MYFQFDRQWAFITRTDVKTKTTAESVIRTGSAVTHKSQDDTKRAMEMAAGETVSREKHVALVVDHFHRNNSLSEGCVLDKIAR